MKIADFSYQSVTPSNPSPNRIGLFADSGTLTLLSLVSGGVARSIGIQYTGSVPGSSIATGMGQLQTGAFYGGTGVGVNSATGLSSPFAWLPVISSNGTNLAIPAYLLR